MEQIDDNSIAVVVDVIIPVHNAASTIRSSVQSAMHQVIPSHLESFFFCDKKNYRWDIAVCCFDDGSTDDSWHILSELEREFQQEKCGRDEAAFCNENTKIRRIPCGFHFLIARGSTGSRGAGFARNQAATLRSKLLPGSSTSSRDLNHSFLCLLDSDDIMHSTRIAEQAHYMLTLPKGRELTLLGCTFDRDPADSTWHYAKWANGLPDERLYLERFREVTIIQPTWMMCRSRWEYLGGYLEAPDEQQTIDDHITLKTLSTSPKSSAEVAKALQHQNKRFCLVHPTLETPCTLRLAEDLRFFHAHVHDHGLLKLLRTEIPLVTYRHRAGMSQSCNTPRRLLLYLRVLAFESCVLRLDPRWSGSFVVWGAGRDGKDFIKHLADDTRRRVVCLVDVDTKKIESGHYINGNIRIPIVHFSWLARDANACKLLYDESIYGSITKKKTNDGWPSHGDYKNPVGLPFQTRSGKKLRTGEQQVAPIATALDLSQLPDLPVVVCVSMYRTSGALERNVTSIGRTEGQDLWHFT